MPLVVKDRVKETTTTTGTGTITLAGAASGFQSFSVIGNGNTTYYAIVGGTEWEVGIGTYTSSGTTLSRDTVLESSTGGTKVDFAAGTKDVFCTYPAEKSVYTDGSDNVTLPSNLSVNGTTTLGDASGDSVTFNASTVSTPNGLNFDSNTLVIDATNNRVGVGIATPTVALDVVGVIEAQAAATQDAVRIQGRAGGSSSYAATITPATLTASRTVTLPDATGTAMVSGAMPTFRAYASTTQTVTLSTFTKIAIDTEDFDTASCFDTSLYRFTPNVAGYYQVNGTLRGKVVTTFNTILLSLYKNGSGYTRTQVLATLAANNNNAISTNEVVYMNGTTDYLELYGILGGSGTATFDSTSSTVTSTFSAVLVRAA
jgi:hypothetical protein